MLPSDAPAHVVTLAGRFGRRVEIALCQGNYDLAHRIVAEGEQELSTLRRLIRFGPAIRRREKANAAQPV